MIFSFPYFTLAYLAGGVVCLVIAVVMWNRRPGPGIVPLTYLAIASSVWVLAGALEAGAVELSAKIIFSKIGYTGMAAVGVFWLAFAQDYSGSTWWKRPRNIVLLSVIPLVTIIIIWTNDIHHWQWSRIYLSRVSMGEEAVFEPGPWYLANPIYQYVLFGWGIYILCRFGLRRPGMQKQTIVILTSTVLVLIASILYVSGIKPAGGYDISPLYISVLAVIYGITIFRFRFLNILPIAYRALIKSIPDGVMVLDSRGNIVEMNQATEKILNQTEFSSRGKPLAWIWPELNARIMGLSSFVHSELTVDNNQVSRFLDVNAVVLVDNRKKAAGTLIMLRDISDLKKAQQDIKDLYDEEHKLRGSLEEEINKRSQYTRAVVHELRTPLTSIIASVDLLEDQIKDPLQQKLVQNVLRSSLNLERRVNELFELARGELGLIKLNTADFDMNELIRDLNSELAPLAFTKGLALKTDMPQSALPVRADRDRLRQVIINLVSNAIKFTEKGEIIIAAGKGEQGFVTVEVTDTGRGMDPQELENLFDPYRRKAREGGSSGLGLGLAISKIIVELHKGTIHAASQPGKGTIITFNIPGGTPSG